MRSFSLAWLTNDDNWLSYVETEIRVVAGNFPSYEMTFVNYEKTQKTFPPNSFFFFHSVKFNLSDYF